MNLNFLDLNKYMYFGILGNQNCSVVFFLLTLIMRLDLFCCAICVHYFLEYKSSGLFAQWGNLRYKLNVVNRKIEGINIYQEEKNIPLNLYLSIPSILLFTTFNFKVQISSL